MCQHRAIDLYRERRERSFELLADIDLVDERWMAAATQDDADSTAERALLQDALEVQEDVRRKVKPARWEAFWRVVIEDESINEAAAAMGLKYATVYAGVNHVAQLLRAEGERRTGRLGPVRPQALERG
jgi:DNA-directed RNA polymerase specialized sigma24 family protein